MKADVFTLFPQWFDWYRTQRHVANVLALGHALDCVDPRATTTLSGAAVDDTPFGGGAGMVLRVDVMERALRARYGVDPVDLLARRRDCSLRHSLTRAWWPDRSTSGTVQPRQSAGRV